jgi:hypothetical protein
VTELRAIWAGPGALRALAAGGAGTVEIALHPGGYIHMDGGDYVLVATPRSPRGPLTAVVAGLAAAPLTAGARLHLAAPLGEAAPLAPAAPLRAGWRAALAAALAAAPPPPADLARGLAALRRGDLPAAVAALAGRGPGLTPAGDDVLAGFAAWRRTRGLASPRCSPLGLAYLRCAERGELPEVVERVVSAIRGGDASLARQRARRLPAWGSTSGAAMLWGVAAGASS